MSTAAPDPDTSSDGQVATTWPPDEIGKGFRRSAYSSHQVPNGSPPHDVKGSPSWGVSSHRSQSHASRAQLVVTPLRPSAQVQLAPYSQPGSKPPWPPLPDGVFRGSTVPWQDRRAL